MLFVKPNQIIIMMYFCDARAILGRLGPLSGRYRGNRIVNITSNLLFLTIELLSYMVRLLKFSTTFSRHLLMVYLLLQISYLTVILCSYTL